MNKEIREDIIKLIKNHQIGFDDYGETADKILFLVAGKSADFELQRLLHWLQDDKRQPAQTKFTKGMTRNVAREIEYLLKHSS